MSGISHGVAGGSEQVSGSPVGQSLAPADSNLPPVVTAVGVSFSSVRNRCCALEKKTSVGECILMNVFCRPTCFSVVNEYPGGFDVLKSAFLLALVTFLLCNGTPSMMSLPHSKGHHAFLSGQNT